MGQSHHCKPTPSSTRRRIDGHISTGTSCVGQTRASSRYTVVCHLAVCMLRTMPHLLLFAIPRPPSKRLPPLPIHPSPPNVGVITAPRTRGRDAGNPCTLRSMSSSGPQKHGYWWKDRPRVRCACALHGVISYNDNKFLLYHSGHSSAHSIYCARRLI